MINRREMLAVIGALAASGTAFAQAAIPLVVVLFHGPEKQNRSRLDAFQDGLRELGYVEGKSYRLEVRWNEQSQDHLNALARELLALKPAIAVGAPVLAAQAFQRESGSLPIVMATGTGALGVGLIKSLARPGGNVTGVTNQADELTAKLFDLMNVLAPQARRIAVVSSGKSLVERETRAAAHAASKALALTSIDILADSREATRGLAARCKSERCDALVFLIDPNLLNWRADAMAAVASIRLPAIYFALEFAEEGGLIAYAPDIRQAFRRSAYFVDKILKGAKPADLPVEQPTQFELAINMKTAKTLGLKIPQSLLVRATKVIE